MLHFETIEPGTLDILTRLLSSPEFSELRLAGGTALALQVGHRKSVDIDLFGTISVDPLDISLRLNSIGKTVLLHDTPNIHIFSVNGIKVDIVNYPYPWLDHPICSDRLRLATKNDIAAMKLAAITNRGTKKDFFDLYFLLQEFKLKQMLDLYSQKFHDGSPFLVLKSLTYFDDAENDPTPVMLAQISWDTVKKYIQNEIKNFSGKQRPSAS